MYDEETVKAEAMAPRWGYADAALEGVFEFLSQFTSEAGENPYIEDLSSALKIMDDETRRLWEAAKRDLAVYDSVLVARPPDLNAAVEALRPRMERP